VGVLTLSGYRSTTGFVKSRGKSSAHDSNVTPLTVLLKDQEIRHEKAPCREALGLEVSG